MSSLFLVITIRFNKESARPDAAQDDYLSTFTSTQSTTNEIGFRFVLNEKIFLEIKFDFVSSDENYTENVLEKQADLIRYLRERNDHLTGLVHQSHHV
jgi:hypothetical protein